MNENIIGQGREYWPTTNGRVNIIGQINTLPFQLSDKIPVKQPSDYRDAMVGNWMDTPLSLTFFSSENIKILQNAIRRGVYDRSNKKFIIGEQNNDELKTIMRSTFLQNSVNLPCNIKEQIISLNNLVLAYAIEHVYKEAVGYIKYKRDASTMYILQPHPVVSRNYDLESNQLERFF